MTRDDLYDHYRRYYVPNNAVMAVAGDFDTKPCPKRIKELYGRIPKPHSHRAWRGQNRINGEVRLSVEGPGETTYIQVSYRFPAASNPDFFALVRVG